MRIEISCFSAQGQRLGERLREKLHASGDEAALTRCGGQYSGNAPTLSEWTGRVFSNADALVFISATGIAIRAIATEIQSKASDPAVVVLDETGKFVISLLSGHIGGANDLSRRIAKILDATPVITTATDCNELFSIDAWATKYRYAIPNPEKIKSVSAKILAGDTVRVKTLLPVVSHLPKYVEYSTGGYDVYIGCQVDENMDALHIVPPMAVLGVGCKKGTPRQDVENAFIKLCIQANVYTAAFRQAYSIDLKMDEPGLLEFCRKYGLSFATFSAAELNSVEGGFSTSRFVQEVTGVDTVCERSAVLGGRGKLYWPKTVIDGVALAIGLKDIRLDFDTPADTEEGGYV